MKHATRRSDAQVTALLGQHCNAFVDRLDECCWCEFIFTQGECAKVAQERTTFRQQAHDDSDDMVKRSEGLKGVLQTVGLELEKALTTIF